MPEARLQPAPVPHLHGRGSGLRREEDLLALIAPGTFDLDPAFMHARLERSGFRRHRDIVLGAIRLADMDGHE